MKTSPFSLAALAGAVLLALPVSRARAINVSEPPDFANTAAAAATFTLEVGSNQFTGQIPQGGSDADHFKVIVPTGRKITQIGGFGSGITVPSGVPLYAGTYAVAVAPGQVLSDMNWGVTFTVAAAPDYDVTAINNQVILFDRSGFGDTLTVSEPFGNTIKFAAPGRTFSVDGAAYTTGDSGSFIPFNDISNVITSVTVHAGAGHDTIQVGHFPQTSFPSLTINGGMGRARASASISRMPAPSPTPARAAW